jgi:L-ribulokinase
MPKPPYALGCDFGTESVRAVILGSADGRTIASATAHYPHGVIDRNLPTGGEPLPPDFAFQHPQDWLDSLAAACKSALAAADISAEEIAGLGVAFTSCTMLPGRRDGTPLCMTADLSRLPFAWPKLWKHHGATAQAQRITRIAQERREAWLSRYGGTIGVEWFFPKILETLDKDPRIYESAQIWLEAGDWLVWQLVSGPFPKCSPDDLYRSTCQAGYKAMWQRDGGYPSSEFFAAVHPKLRDVVAEKMPGKLAAPGTRAGLLTESAARMLGLSPGIPVAVATIDAHAGVPGAGVADDDTLVMVLGTSSCHMLNSKTERLVPGIAGVVADGILPGSFGYETGQASVGDAFAWVARLANIPHDQLNALAAKLPAGSGGVLAIDWLNGCRTPLMDGHLSGGFIGLTLGTRPEQLYRAMIEATAMGVRWIRDTFRQSDIPIRQYVASGGLGAKSPLLMQIYADVLNAPITLAATDQPVAVGAAILGQLAAENTTDHAAVHNTVTAMTPSGNAPVRYVPDAKSAAKYDEVYSLYRALTDAPMQDIMHRLRGL